MAQVAVSTPHRLSQIKTWRKVSMLLVRQVSQLILIQSSLPLFLRRQTKDSSTQAIAWKSILEKRKQIKLSTEAKPIPMRRLKLNSSLSEYVWIFSMYPTHVSSSKMRPIANARSVNWSSKLSVPKKKNLFVRLKKLRVKRIAWRKKRKLWPLLNAEMSKEICPVAVVKKVPIRSAARAKQASGILLANVRTLIVKIRAKKWAWMMKNMTKWLVIYPHQHRWKTNWSKLYVMRLMSTIIYRAAIPSFSDRLSCWTTFLVMMVSNKSSSSTSINT